MFKLSLAAIFWTLALAIPFTVAALIGAAYLIENAAAIAAFIRSFGQPATVGGRTWVEMLSVRLPELAGMIVGQLVLLTIFIFARQTSQKRPIG